MRKGIAMLSGIRARLRPVVERGLSATRLDRLTLKERFLLFGILAALIWGAVGTTWENAHRIAYPAGHPRGLYQQLREALPDEAEIKPSPPFYKSQ